MKNFFTIICLTTIQDHKSGLYSFINYIDSGIVKSIPDELPGFEVFSKWTVLANKSNLNAKLICHRPDDSQEILHEVKDFSATEGIFSISIALEKFIINDSGVHYIQIVIEDLDAKKSYFGNKQPIFIVESPKKSEEKQK